MGLCFPMDEQNALARDALQIRLASFREKKVIAPLLEAYLRDLSVFGLIVLPYRYFDHYWQEPGERLPYLIEQDEKIVGFAFVRADPEPDIDFQMAEFCILADHRRTGIGALATSILLHRHPGRWNLAAFRKNIPACIFWPRAITEAGAEDLEAEAEGQNIRFTFKIR